jgi:hypothetical protein
MRDYKKSPLIGVSYRYLALEASDLAPDWLIFRDIFLYLKRFEML